MKFFNPKEEVLDIKLTNYGRHLLSKGLWRPTFYSFMDDNVLYDSQYGGFTESKNSAEGRIQDETPLLRSQGIFNGRDEHLFDGVGDITDRMRLSTYEKMTVMPFSLGTSALDSTKLPAIRMQFLEGEIKDLEFNSTGSTRTTKTGGASNALSHQLLKIPQIEMDVEYKITVAPPNTPEKRFEVDPALTPGTLYADGNEVLVGPEQIIIVAEEINAPFDFHNFDIEVYEITDDFDVNGEQIKVPLNFVKPLEMVENNILLDREEAEVKAGRINGATPPLDPSFVSYYFDINVDSEISETILCKSISQLSRKGKSLFTDVNITCPDLSDVIVEPIYASDALDEDCPDY
tara:strand:+ start:119 stop:1159 length:1041 start_codon:yes stop_codon:yes gene_type:complete